MFSFDSETHQKDTLTTNKQRVWKKPSLFVSIATFICCCFTVTISRYPSIYNPLKCLRNKPSFHVLVGLVSIDGSILRSQCPCPLLHNPAPPSGIVMTRISRFRSIAAYFREPRIEIILPLQPYAYFFPLCQNPELVI